MYKLIRNDGQKYTFDYDGVEVTTSGKVIFIGLNGDSPFGVSSATDSDGNEYSVRWRVKLDKDWNFINNERELCD
jgi:hypothetical protein|nr:MAG TPA: hypothetical protein [Caudoviricetes sp.]